MKTTGPPWKHYGKRLILSLVGAILCGCIGFHHFQAAYDYFGTPSLEDPWSMKISSWQSRERLGAILYELESAPSVSDSGTTLNPSVAPETTNLREKYFSFRAEQKRRMARGVAEWIQTEAKLHYIDDGPIDHWATLEETLQGNGDDCDGLELLVYHALRDLGFKETEVFRAIVYRVDDGQHHMVTLWFEDRNDPWVIDPTGAMTANMPRMSEVPGWVPIKIFSEDAEFTVHSDSVASPDVAASAEGQ